MNLVLFILGVVLPIVGGLYVFVTCQVSQRLTPPVVVRAICIGAGPIVAGFACTAILVYNVSFGLAGPGMATAAGIALAVAGYVPAVARMRDEATTVTVGDTVPAEWADKK